MRKKENNDTNKNPTHATEPLDDDSMNQHFEHMFNLYKEVWKETETTVESFLRSDKSDPLTIKDKNRFNTRLYDKLLGVYNDLKQNGTYNNVRDFLNSSDSDPLTIKNISKFEKSKGKWKKGESIGRQVEKIARNTPHYNTKLLFTPIAKKHYENERKKGKTNKD